MTLCQVQSPDSRVKAERIKMAEEAQVPSRAPKWFQFLDLKWSQPRGSHFPWYVSLPGFMAVAGSCICCYGFLSYLSESS